MGTVLVAVAVKLRQVLAKGVGGEFLDFRFMFVFGI
jgi:hypothetical protein